MADEIIEELWRTKDNLAKQLNCNLDALGAELQRRQKEPGKKVVDLAKQATEERYRAEPSK